MINNFNKKINIKLKKTFLILAFILQSSCINQNYQKFGKLSFHSSSNDKLFIFTIDDNFYKKYTDSKASLKHPRLTEDELKMLKSLLKSQRYCLNKSSNPEFEILSRQEKIFDATFANLIAQNYNARPLTPVSYYGKCI